MILTLRGHIRNSFDTLDLFNLVNGIYQLQPDLKIYIHTWDIHANNISWRPVQGNNNVVTKELIQNYFGDLSHLIKTILIDNDKSISLTGNLNGNVHTSGMPLVGWKNYWYGNYQVVNAVKELDSLDPNEMIINTRIDLITYRPGFFTHQQIIDFVKRNIGTIFTKNVFIHDHEAEGIDNIYCGNIDTMYKLAYHFNYHLDDILADNRFKVHNQEKIVFRVNELI